MDSRIKDQLIHYLIKIYHHSMHDSLYRNSIYLVVNTGITGVTALLFWIIIAHLFSTSSVGKATALLAAVGLISSFASLGLTRTVVRFLAKADNKSQDIVTKMLLSIVAAIIVSCIVAYYLPHLKVYHATKVVVLLVIISGIITVLKNLFDNIFIAFRAAGHTLIENTVTNISRLILIFFVVTLGYVGIFISQIGATFLGLILCFYLLKRRHNIKFTVKPSSISMSSLWSYSIGSYFNDLIGGLPTTVIPLLIIAKIGSSNAAFWYISMQIATFLFLICQSINQSLFAEAANQERYLLHYIGQAAKVMFGIIIPVSAIFIVFAPLILSIFGGEYRQGTEVLRFLALSSLLVAGNFITGTILFMYKKVLYIAMINMANALVVIVGSFMFGTSLNRFGIIWIIGEVVNILLFGGGAMYFLQKRKHSSLAKEVYFGDYENEKN